MSVFGIIGGSGFYDFPELGKTKSHVVKTDFGTVGTLESGVFNGNEIFFLPRHGQHHTIPPHKVNYRANIEALKLLGVEYILAFNACGGIYQEFCPGKIVIPDQIIDYTFDREHTFYDGFGDSLKYVDFTHPFDTKLQNALKQILEKNAFVYRDGATYGCVQGPRLETVAEIKKMRRDGCDLVGMTLMPEAVLAREKEIPYVSLCLIVNYAAGVGKEAFELNEIMACLESFVPKIREVMLKSIAYI